MVGGRETQSYLLLSSVVCVERRILDFLERKQKHALIHEMGMVEAFVKLQHLCKHPPFF